MKDEYFFGYEITKDCLVGSKKILEKYGITNPGTSSNVYQLMVEQNGNLVHYGNAGAVSANYSNALACIDRHLQDGRPIIIGINHSPNMNRNEGATDHFMVITGKGYDSDKQQYYYTYADPGRKSAATGCDMENNRLYYNPDTCEFYDPEAGKDNDRFDVTQVRPNDGKYLDETIVQPLRP